MAVTIIMIGQIVLAMSLVKLVDATTLVTGTPMRCNDIINMLDYHDRKRNEVALGLTKLPKAKNMFAMKWSDSLAKVAQDYANKCKFEHNKKRPKGSGENLSIHGKKKKLFADIIKMNDMWFNEMKDYDYYSASNELHKVGHLTQLIWADTKFVGCGVSLFKDDSDFPYKTLVVCDYEPQGNYPGVKPYVESPDNTTTCDNGMYHSIYKGLCAQDKDHQAGKYKPCSGDANSSPKLQCLSYTVLFSTMIYILGICKCF